MSVVFYWKAPFIVIQGGVSAQRSHLGLITGITVGWMLYGKRQRKTAAEKDVLEAAQPAIYKLLENKYFIDEIYEATVVRFNAFAAWLCDFADKWIFGGR